MIHYFVTHQQSGPMRSFLETWGKSLAGRMKIVTYESYFDGREQLPNHGASFIFTNLAYMKHWTAEARSAICNLHDRLVETHGTGRVLNDPARTLQRYDMLRLLHARGINAFNVYRAADPDIRPRYPVFLRHEFDRIFRQPALAYDAAQYEALVRGTRWLVRSLAEFVTVEYCDTADTGGLHRKYGAFVVGDRIVPRHIFFSRDWHIRFADLIDPEKVDEEERYITGNPHANALLECARLAGVAYGRIDYGLLDGRPQIWEINLNAGLTTSSQAVLPQRRKVLLGFVEQFAGALEAVDSGA
jgi:hypothetical protein